MDFLTTLLSRAKPASSPSASLASTTAGPVVCTSSSSSGVVPGRHRSQTKSHKPWVLKPFIPLSLQQPECRGDVAPGSKANTAGETHDTTCAAADSATTQEAQKRRREELAKCLLAANRCTSFSATSGQTGNLLKQLKSNLREYAPPAAVSSASSSSLFATCFSSQRPSLSASNDSNSRGSPTATRNPGSHVPRCPATLVAGCGGKAGGGEEARRFLNSGPRGSCIVSGSSSLQTSRQPLPCNNRQPSVPSRPPHRPGGERPVSAATSKGSLFVAAPRANTSLPSSLPSSRCSLRHVGDVPNAAPSTGSSRGGKQPQWQQSSFAEPLPSSRSARRVIGKRKRQVDARVVICGIPQPRKGSENPNGLSGENSGPERRPAKALGTEGLSRSEPSGRAPDRHSACARQWHSGGTLKTDCATRVSSSLQERRQIPWHDDLDEMDEEDLDFIDDGLIPDTPATGDWQAQLRSVTGYDPEAYRGLAAQECSEASVRTQMLEERYSCKVGAREDRIQQKLIEEEEARQRRRKSHKCR